MILVKDTERNINVKNMSWFEYAQKLGLICGLCGSLLTPNLSCSDVHCRKHEDIPVEHNSTFPGWITRESVVGTASIVSGSISPSQEIEEGDEG